MSYDEEEVIENEASYNLKSPFLKGEVAKDHINRCLIARSKEMRSGYFNTSKSNSGEEIREYIGDSRKAFISSVNALYSLLYPEIQEDEKIKNRLNNINRKEKGLYNKFAFKDVEVVNGKLVETGAKYMPDIDDVIKFVGKGSRGENIIKSSKGVWNKRISYYWEQLVEMYDKKFNILNQLVHNLDYFNPEAAGY